MKILRGVLLVMAALGFAACGGGSSGGGSAQTCNPGATASVTISATGLSPTNVCITPGGQVAFVNSDPAATHDIEFDTSGCPVVGDVSPGGQVTATFPATQVNCSFHDGRNTTNTAFRGTVAVTAVQVSGGGY